MPETSLPIRPLHLTSSHPCARHQRYHEACARSSWGPRFSIYPVCEAIEHRRRHDDAVAAPPSALVNVVGSHGIRRTTASCRAHVSARALRGWRFISRRGHVVKPW